MGRRRGLSGTVIGTLIAIALAFAATLVWPDGGLFEGRGQTASRSGASDTAYWAKQATLEAEADAALRAAQAKTPAARTAPPTGLNGELDMLPTHSSGEAVRLTSAAPSGRRMFSGCNAARAAGYENIPAGHPAYHPDMDGDGDGLACEPLPRGGRRY